MAISGAFGAGFVEGFATSFEKSVKERREKYDEHLDNQLTMAKSMAPSYAKSNAEVQQQLELMGVFEKEFGIDNTEFVALAQNYDVGELYTTFAAHKQSLPEHVRLRKQDLLSVLDIKETDAMKLPDGMTPEQALRASVLGYTRNISENPNDKSEGKKNKSWGKAISDTLMLNPKANAEEAIKQMQVMGIPVEELLLYQAAQVGGTDYDPVAGIGRATGILGDLKTDYKPADYQTTTKTYTSFLTRNFSNGQFEDVQEIPENTIAALNIFANEETDTGAKRAALGQAVLKGGTSFATFELDLLRKGYYNGFNTEENRSSVMLALAAEINTKQELDAFQEAVANGSLVDMILEEGAVTEDVIDKLFGDGETEEKPEPKVVQKNVEPDPMSLEQASDTVSGIVDQAVKEDTEEAIAATQDEPIKNSSIVSNAISSNEDEQLEVGGVKAATAADTAQRNIDNQNKFIEAAKNYTYDEYKAMSRAEKKAAGLPENNLNFRFAYGYLNPAKYFKGYEDTKSVSEELITRTDFLTSESGRKLLDYLLDDMAMEADDSDEEYKQAVAAYFADNEKELMNLGSEVTADYIARVMKNLIGRM